MNTLKSDFIEDIFLISKKQELYTTIISSSFNIYFFQNRILIFFKIQRDTPGTLVSIIYLDCLQAQYCLNGGLLPITTTVPLNVESGTRKCY